MKFWKNKNKIAWLVMVIVFAIILSLPPNAQFVLGVLWSYNLLKMLRYELSKN